MTAKASIGIYDASATPEAPGTPGAALRTFVPGEVENNNVHTFYDTTTGVTAATRSKMTLAIVPGEQVTRVKVSLALPKAQTVDGIIQAAHITRANCEFLCPVNGSRDDRRDIKTLLINALNHTDVATMIGDLENLW